MHGYNLSGIRRPLAPRMCTCRQYLLLSHCHWQQTAADIAIARNQASKWWEIRTAVSLARRWQGQSKVVEARELLAPIYNWFSEGFDTPDLMDAKTLLDELA